MLDLRRAAILGAIGPAGRHLVAALLARGAGVRVVGRREGRLAATFGALPVERVVADAQDPEATARAIEGRDVAFDGIGLPLAQIADHPVTARGIAQALRTTGARGMQISSFWAYLPARRLPPAEDHPRTGGNPLVLRRREAEDILRAAGGGDRQPAGLLWALGAHQHAAAGARPGGRRPDDNLDRPVRHRA